MTQYDKLLNSQHNNKKARVLTTKTEICINRND